jgi:hypothetical protein
MEGFSFDRRFHGYENMAAVFDAIFSIFERSFGFSGKK